MNKCPDCQGDLEKGAILDSTYGATLVQRFAKSNNIPTDSSNIIKGNNEANFEDLRRVVALRCTKCNRIFQYAQETITIQNLNRRTRWIWIIILGATALITLLIVLFS